MYVAGHGGRTITRMVAGTIGTQSTDAGTMYSEVAWCCKSLAKGLAHRPCKTACKALPKGWHCKHKHATKLQAKMENAK